MQIFAFAAQFWIWNVIRLNIKQLVSTGANIDGHDEEGLSVLQKWAKKGHVKIVKFLLEKGAKDETVEGEACLSYAQKIAVNNS